MAEEEPRSSSSGPPSRSHAGKAARRQLPLWQETILLLGVALVLAIVIKALFLQAFYIPSESMEPGLVRNDRILVQKVSYWGGGEPRARRRRRLQGPGWLAARVRGGRSDGHDPQGHGQGRALPDRRAPGEARDRRRGRRHQLLRRPGPPDGQRRSPSTRRAYVKDDKAVECAGPMVNQCCQGLDVRAGARRARLRDGRQPRPLRRLEPAHVQPREARPTASPDPSSSPSTSSSARSSCCSGRVTASTGSPARARSRTCPTPREPGRRA